MSETPVIALRIRFSKLSELRLTNTGCLGTDVLDTTGNQLDAMSYCGRVAS